MPKIVKTEYKVLNIKGIYAYCVGMDLLYFTKEINRYSL